MGLGIVQARDGVLTLAGAKANPTKDVRTGLRPFDAPLGRGGSSGGGRPSDRDLAVGRAAGGVRAVGSGAPVALIDEAIRGGGVALVAGGAVIAGAGTQIHHLIDGAVEFRI